jgi:hypothetical protein
MLASNEQLCELKCVFGAVPSDASVCVRMLKHRHPTLMDWVLI